MAVIGLPLLVYGGVSGGLIASQITAARIERSARIENYIETPILWPGLPEPVGLHIEFELHHASAPEGSLFPPKILMGNSVALSYRSYDSEYFSRRAYLTAPLFHFVNPDPLREAERISRERRVLMAAQPAHLAYDLYPGNIWRLGAPGQACFVTSAPVSRHENGEGENLSAIWYFAASGGVRVDLSGLLTDVLRKQSALQNRLPEWTSMLEGLQPEAMQQAGYEPCPNTSSFGASELCLCGDAR
jgi:hypothetical protein